MNWLLLLSSGEEGAAVNSFTGSSMSSEEDSVPDMGEEVIRHEVIVAKKLYIHNQ